MHIYHKNIMLLVNKTEWHGIHIECALDSQQGNSSNATDKGVFVSKIDSNSAAKRDGRLKVPM